MIRKGAPNASRGDAQARARGENGHGGHSYAHRVRPYAAPRGYGPPVVHMAHPEPVHYPAVSVYPAEPWARGTGDENGAPVVPERVRHTPSRAEPEDPDSESSSESDEESAPREPPRETHHRRHESRRRRREEHLRGLHTSDTHAIVSVFAANKNRGTSAFGWRSLTLLYNSSVHILDLKELEAWNAECITDIKPARKFIVTYLTHKKHKDVDDLFRANQLLFQSVSRDWKDSEDFVRVSSVQWIRVVPTSEARSLDSASGASVDRLPDLKKALKDKGLAPKVEKMLHDADIDDVEALIELERKDLKDMGMSVGNVKKVLLLIEELKALRQTIHYNRQLEQAKKDELTEKSREIASLQHAIAQIQQQLQAAQNPAPTGHVRASPPPFAIPPPVAVPERKKIFEDDGFDFEDAAELPVPKNEDRTAESQRVEDPPRGEDSEQHED